MLACQQLFPFRLFVNFLPLHSAILQMETAVALHGDTPKISLGIVKNLEDIFMEIPGLKSPQGS